jgi:hypothetical protein
LPDDPILVTLTSIPPRFAHLGPTLQSLLAQDVRPAEIVLIIPHRYRRFPRWDGSLPDLPRGIRLHRSDEDFGPATKILPMVQAHAGQAVDLLLCDDDSLYAPGWLRAFRDARARHPSACIAASGQHLPGLADTPHDPDRMPRASRWTRAGLAQLHPRPDPLPVLRTSGFADLFEGWAGAMLRPDWLHPGVFKLPPVLWTVDDPWLSAHLEAAGVPIWCSADIPAPRRRHDVGGIDGLVAAVIDGHDRDAADLACIRHCRRHLGIWNRRPPLKRQAVLAFRQALRRAVPRSTRHRLLVAWARWRGWPV